MKEQDNIIESVEFLAEEDLLVAELDRRLSFTAAAGTRHDMTVPHCHGVSVCGCLLVEACTCVRFVAASAVRG